MTNLTQTEKTLLAVLGAALAGRRMTAQELPPDADGQKLMKLAQEHKVLPLLVDALSPEGLTGPELKRLARSQMVRQTIRTQEFFTLYEKMEQEGLYPLVTKGIVCRSLYPRGDLRPSSDEDLLVTDGEFDRCCDFLRREGFEPLAEKTPDAGEIGWRNEKTGLFLELHRRLFDGNIQENSHMEGLFSRAAETAVSYPVEGTRTVRSMEPGLHLSYLVLHAYKHFLHSGFGIRQVADIGLWAKRYGAEIDWQALCDDWSACRAERFAAAVFSIAADALGIPLELPARLKMAPEEWEPLLLDVLCGGVYGSADLDRLHSAAMTLQAAKTGKASHRTGILRSLFPNRAAMAGKYAYVEKYPALLPLAWGQRIVGYLAEGRKNRTSAQVTLDIGKQRIGLLKLYDVVD